MRKLSSICLYCSGLSLSVFCSVAVCHFHKQEIKTGDYGQATMVEKIDCHI